MLAHSSQKQSEAHQSVTMAAQLSSVLGTAQRPVYSTFKSHFDGHSTSTRLVLLEALRRRYPEHHVTCIEKDTADFPGFAKSGKATLATEPEDGQSYEMCEAVRTYKGPRRRLDHKQGHLADEEKFCRYVFTYNDEDFTLYSVSWVEGAYRETIEYWFILSPKEGATIKDGNHSGIDAMLLEVAQWTSIPHDEIYVFDDSYWTKSNDLWLSVQDASWNDVIMEQKMKQNLIEDVQGFFDNEDLYKKFGVPWKRGIILHGIPGNGKTISIKALMHHLGSLAEPIPSLYVKSLDNKCNMPQYSVNQIFHKARQMAPCLLVLEDLDSMIVDKVRSYFLNEVDGLESNDGILMVGSTNHLSRLDPAISKRPSRFDRKYQFKVPDRAQRIAYAEYWRQKLQKNTDANIDFPSEICPHLADLTDGFSFAYMKELMVMSLLTVARGGTGIETPGENGWDVVSEEAGDTSESSKEDAKEDAEGAGDKKDKKEKKKPREVPVIEVSEELKENVLLRVAQQQVRILLHEMDNTDEEESEGDLLSGDASKDKEPESACTSCRGAC